MLCSGFAFAEGTDINGTELFDNQTSETAQDSQTVAETVSENKDAPMFSDVPEDAPYADDVKKLVEYGIIAGYPDGTFRPYGEVTRAEMCKMINLTLGYTDFLGVTGFSDVTTSNWYYAFALSAQKAGYIKGYEDGSFGGGRNITRQEVCTILVRLLKPMDLGIPVTINDTVSGWAKNDVELVVQNFIMPLEEGNTFRATENLKRHELASVLSNLAIGPVKSIDADVRFFVNGVQYGETQTVQVGESVQLPVNPTPEDETYVFDGWRIIGTTDVTEVASIIVLNDVDYEAVFVKKSYNVTFNVQSSLYNTQTVNYGGIAQAPSNPELKGYDFVGWSLTDGGSVVKISSTPITEETAFYAVFEKESTNDSAGGGGGGGGETTKTYTVKFFVNGDVYESQKVDKGDSPSIPSAPTRDGYDFVGWSLEADGETISISSISVTKNITLYAVFQKTPEPEPEQYTVTFVSDGKTYDTQIVTHGETASNPGNPSKDGYNFVGWSKSEGGAVVILGYVTITSDTTFYALFEEKQVEKKYFDVYFYADGKLHDSTTAEEGTTVSAPQAPVKDGYNFIGWSRSESGTAVSVNSVTITEDTIFYALFEKKPEEIVYYTVTFVSDGKTVDTQTVKKGETAKTPADAEKEGYNFVGWSKDKTDVVDVTAATVTADITYYAVFEKIQEVKVYYTVEFVSDGKTIDTQSVLECEYPTLPAEPEKEGYDFLGWSKTQNGATVKPDAIKVESNITYYAVFEEVVVEVVYYEVTFIVEGEIYKSYEVADGGYAIAPSVTGLDETSSFIGWATKENADEDDVVEVEDVVINKDTTFYAVIFTNPNDPLLLEMLSRGYTQLMSLRLSGANNVNKKDARDLIAECISLVLDDANNGTYVDTDYINSTYGVYVNKVSHIVNTVMTEDESADFINLLTNSPKIDQDVRDFLSEYFGLE